MRYTQPQSGPVRIDWSNPLTRGLAIALVPGMPDAVSGSLAVQSGSSSLSTNQAGRAFTSPATQTTGNFKYAVSIPTSFDCTLLRVHSCIAANTPAVGTPSLELNSAELVLACDTGAQSLFSTTGNPSGIISIAAAGNLSVIAGVKAINSQLSYYNGKLLNTSATGNRAIGAITQVSIGRSSGNQFENVKYSLVLYWTRALSAAEIAQVSANPWQVFKSPQRVIMLAAGATDTPVNPGAGAFAMTGYSPTVAQTANQVLTPSAGSFAITGCAPAISQPQAITAGAGTVSLAGYAPSITQGLTTAVVPAAGVMQLTGYQPSVAQTLNQSAAPDSGAISVTGHPPVLAQSNNVAVAPISGPVVISGFAPSIVQASSAVGVAPSAGLLQMAGYAPLVAQSGARQYPLAGQSQDRPLAGQSQTYPLQGQV